MSLINQGANDFQPYFFPVNSVKKKRSNRLDNRKEKFFVKENLNKSKLDNHIPSAGFKEMVFLGIE